MKRLFFYSLLMAGCVLSSCKKDETSARSKTELISARPWKLTAKTSKIGNDPTDNQMYRSSCDNDDLYLFRANNTHAIDEGATKCNPNRDQTIESGNWAFTSNETKLSLFSSPSDNRPWIRDIVELTATTLKIRETNPYNRGGGIETVIVKEEIYTAQ